MKKQNIILIIISIIFTMNCFGQNLNSFNYKIKLVPTGEVLNEVDTVYTYLCEVDLKNLENITKLHFKMGTTKGGDEKFSYSFNKDESGNLPTGVSLEQNDEVMTIMIGNFIAEAYWYEVVIEDNEGNTSNAKQKQY